MKGTSLLAVTVNIVSISYNSRELGNKFYGLTHQIVTRYVVGIRVKGVHFQNATGKNVHDVASFEVYDVHQRLMVQGHVVVQQFAKSCQFFLIGQLTGKDKEGNLLKAKSFLFQQRSNKVIQFIPAIKQLSVNGFQCPILVL